MGSKFLSNLLLMLVTGAGNVTLTNVFVVGANEVVHPVAKEDLSKPIGGVPLLNVWCPHHNRQQAEPRMSFSGIPNTLFAKENPSMLFGEGKEMMQELVNT